MRAILTEFAPGVLELGLLVGRQRFGKPNQPIAPVGIRNRGQEAPALQVWEALPHPKLHLFGEYFDAGAVQGAVEPTAPNEARSVG
jgi:hypothetical protein